jgi:hypothetical protein
MSADDELNAAKHLLSKRPMQPKQNRRGLATGFTQGDGGKRCEVCQFEGFRWQTECPKGHPLR